MSELETIVRGRIEQLEAALLEAEREYELRSHGIRAALADYEYLLERHAAPAEEVPDACASE